ncbi:hypothetical protein [Burkholderia gladioli]|uniref:hypothetical protein n=1 Tax=Burkholderia gladioli TaxID=28095 RepID=UPI0011D1DC82|nr:hypothetical protein [Burkholderia gladioli]MBW5285071.1 hypothetical protein [Burkholderia gladioli]
MSQEFNKPVGQAIQADQASINGASTTINTGAVSGNVAGRDVINNFRSEEDEDLDDERKQQLTRRAYVLEAKYSLPTWKARRLVNEIVGVPSQDVMRVRHFLPASKVYDLLFEREEAKLKSVDSPEAASLREQLQGAADTIIMLTDRNGHLMGQNKKLRGEYETLVKREKSARIQAEAARDQVEALRAQAAQVAQASQRPVVVARPRRHLAVSVVIVGVALVALGSLYEVQRAQSSTSIPSQESAGNDVAEGSSTDGTCKGRTELYPVGAIVHGIGGRVECVAGTAGTSPRWVKVK